MALLLALLVQGGHVRAEICKWVDDQGVTHYAERCPDDVGAQTVEIQPPPTQQEIEAAAQRSEALSQQSSARQAPAAPAQRFHSLPLQELGPLPELETSDYLESLGADLAFATNSLNGYFFLRLRARPGLPSGAYIEAHFPHPANPGRVRNVGKSLSRELGEVVLLSPSTPGFKCWNYEIEVDVFRDASRQERLGTHHQTIQSRVDTALVSDSRDLVGALMKGRCPSAHDRAMSRMSVEELEALCEREREKRLGPERDKLIRDCISRGDKSAEWCRNFYADWGDAMRIDRFHSRPALYYDLPECQAARKARESK